MFRSTRSLHLPTRELPLSPDTTVVLHQVYNLLLGLLGRAKLYVDASVHGTTKLVQYFSFMTYCLISKTEKLMFSAYFMDLWNLFQVCWSCQNGSVATVFCGGKQGLNVFPALNFSQFISLYSKTSDPHHLFISKSFWFHCIQGSGSEQWQVVSSCRLQTAVVSSCWLWYTEVADVLI